MTSRFEGGVSGARAMNMAASGEADVAAPLARRVKLVEVFAQQSFREANRDDNVSRLGREFVAPQQVAIVRTQHAPQPKRRTKELDRAGNVVARSEHDDAALFLER